MSKLAFAFCFFLRPAIRSQIRRFVDFYDFPAFLLQILLFASAALCFWRFLLSPRCDFATELSFLWTFYDFPTILQQFCIFVSVLLCSLRFSHKFGFFVLVLRFSLHFGHKFGFFVLVFATDDVFGKVRDRGAVL